MERIADMLTLIVYRQGAVDPDVCEFETRRDMLETERTLRTIIRRHQRRGERPVYGTPVLVLHHTPNHEVTQ
jgi:hypothetical protein